MPSTLAGRSGTSVGINLYLKSQTAECICEQHYLGGRALPDNALTNREGLYLLDVSTSSTEIEFHRISSDGRDSGGCIGSNMRQQQWRQKIDEEERR
jgi:hypothetical protein